MQTRRARIKAAEAYTEACKAHEEAMEDYQDAVRTYCAARLKPAYDYDTGE